MNDMFRIWDECYDSLYKLCRIKLSSFPDEADAVFSDIYSALSDAVKKGTVISFPKAWLYKTANNLIAKKYQELTNRRNKFEDFDKITETNISLPLTADMTDIIITDEEIEIIADDILSSYTEEEQLLLRLFYKEKKSYKEIALILVKTESAVKQQNYRLTRRIKKQVIEKFNG